MSCVCVKPVVTIQFNIAFGGPVGGQAFEELDKQVFKGYLPASPMLAGYMILVYGGGNRNVFGAHFKKTTRRRHS